VVSKGDAESLYDIDYENDPAILDHDELWRRIPPEQIFKDEKTGRWRASSACFDDSSDRTPMSTHLASVVREEGGDPSSVLRGYENFYLVALTAGQVRDPDRGRHGVQRWPVPGDVSHTYVFGKKTRGVRRFFAEVCTTIRVPNRTSLAHDLGKSHCRSSHKRN
jgi:hypothetical protein